MMEKDQVCLLSDRVLDLFMHVRAMGARRNVPEGTKPPTLKMLTRFWRAVQKIDHFSASLKRKRKLLRFLRRFRLKYRVSMASSEGASKNFRVFVGRQQGCQILVTFHAQTRQISSSNRNFQVQTLILRIFALKIHSNISTFITFLFEIIVPSRK